MSEKVKDLPYFKFYPSKWSTGDITLEDMETQGVFINICVLYWSKDCQVEIAKLKHRYGHAIDLLLKSRIIEEIDGYCRIQFLDEQYGDLSAKHKKNSENGSKGAEKRWSDIAYREDKIREDNKSKDDVFFETFRIAYPGTKRGLKTEFDNFKRHKDWREILPKLSETLTAQKKSREIKSGRSEFVPAWKNLKTWINQRCWEDSVEPAASQSSVSNTERPPKPHVNATWNEEKSRWEVNDFFKLQ